MPVRVIAGIAGFILLSPLNLVFGYLGEAFPSLGPLPLAAIYLSDLAGLVVAARAVRSPSVVAIVASLVNVPILWNMGVPEVGPWAGLFGYPKFVAFLGMGLWGLRSKDRSWVRWAGAAVPTLCWIYIFASPWVSEKLGRAG